MYMYVYVLYAHVCVCFCDYLRWIAQIECIVEPVVYEPQQSGIELNESAHNTEINVFRHLEYKNDYVITLITLIIIIINIIPFEESCKESTM